MAKWTGVITNDGANLLRGWAAGETLTITGAEAGSGIVLDAALMAQTGVAGGGRQASLTGQKKLEKAVQVRLQIAAPEQGYTLHQLGIWAALDGGTPALLALYQNQEGVPIPSKADTPDFVYTFYGVVTLNNSGTVEIITDGNAWVTMETLTETVQKAVERLTLAIMTNEVTLPLETAAGEALLTGGAAPIAARYRLERSGTVMAAVEAATGQLAGQISQMGMDARAYAGGQISAAIAAHNTDSSAHPAHLMAVTQ